VAFLAGKAPAAIAVSFYLTTYFVASLGAFGIVALLSKPDREAQDLADWQGLFWRRPWLAGVFTGMVLSLAGLPLTAGFIGEFSLVLAGVGAAMFAHPSQASIPAEKLALSGSLTLAGLTVMRVWLGLRPSPFLEMIGNLIR
jgi:NADH-quinone oxidoreductase subunit N